MEKNKMSKPMAKKVAKALNTVLRTEANSASCAVAYQPKAPKDLMRFKSAK